MKLAAWLKDRAISQAAFAEMVGTRQSSIARYSLGKRIPGRRLMQKIAEVTHGEVTANDFYDNAPRDFTRPGEVVA